MPAQYHADLLIKRYKDIIQYLLKNVNHQICHRLCINYMWEVMHTHTWPGTYEAFQAEDKVTL